MTGFVGIGMGAIQAGLFLPRAQDAGLSRTVLVRRPDQAAAIARARSVTVNVADDGGIRRQTVSDLGAATLRSEAALPALVAAAHIAVAVSSVADYPGFAPLLAEATRAKARGDGPDAVIYASENALDAANLLTRAIVSAGGEPRAFQAVDTVIGKMSRTVRDAAEIEAAALTRGAPDLPEAWLVEAYDDIHVSALDPVRGVAPLPRLLQHDDLLPYERAKLNGHNAAHAALAYMGAVLNLPFISDVLAVPAARDLVFGAFIEETGAALIRRYGGVSDLFTPDGWQAHAVALFDRMANPWLRDDCRRVGRDAARKLGWNDRLVGTIRLVEDVGLDATRWRLAFHVAVEASGLSLDTLAETWRRTGAEATEVDAFLRRVERERPAHESWRRKLRHAAAE
ncbi:MAG: hypothetical protein AAF390_18040 [Pseudomonadota bacterium]